MKIRNKYKIKLSLLSLTLTVPLFLVRPKKKCATSEKPQMNF